MTVVAFLRASIQCCMVRPVTPGEDRGVAGGAAALGGYGLTGARLHGTAALPLGGLLALGAVSDGLTRRAGRRRAPVAGRGDPQRAGPSSISISRSAYAASAYTSGAPRRAWQWPR
ncbi:hypothetical protein GCM10010486_51150 [Nonomuraea roseoviolacea subsp. carminata]